MGPILHFKRNDTRTGVKATLYDQNGAIVNLTGATVKLIGKTSTTIVNRAATIVNAAQGLVLFNFTTAEANFVGDMIAEFEVTFSDGKVETFPNKGYITITFEADLG